MKARSRWYLKKAARGGLATTAWASGWLAASERLGPGPRVRVLTYHRFGNSVRDPFCVTRAQFERHMRWLADSQLAISLATLEAFLAGKEHPPDGAVLVTVDDGFQSVLTQMVPVLKDYGIPVVAYVTPGLLGDGSGSRKRPANGRTEAEEYLTWGDLQRLADQGVVIGSHGWTHRSVGRMAPAAARDEVGRSREILQRRLGQRVSSFAYPYGTRADFSPQTQRILAGSGYTTALTSQHGAVTRRSNPLQLPRIKVEGGEGPWMFRLLCRGAMDAWQLVDRTLWCVQHSGGRP